MATRETTSGLVGIVGDFNPRNPTHQATNQGLAHAGLRSEWLPTEEVVPERLGAYAGLLIAPRAGGAHQAPPRNHEYHAER